MGRHARSSAFGIPLRLLVEWRAYWQLDDALLGNAAALQEACRTLPGRAGAMADPQEPSRVPAQCTDPPLRLPRGSRFEA